MMKGFRAFLAPVDSDAAISDEEAWDKIVNFILLMASALYLGALVYADLTILDLHWTKSALASLIVVACIAGRLGIWTIRKVVLALTLYALGYLVGALPALRTLGDFLTRQFA